jgi:hypothetical protein
MPFLGGGQLWPDIDSDILYLVGGQANNGGDAPSSSQIWYFNTSTSQWGSISKPSDSEVVRAYSSGGTVVPEMRKGFALGGINGDDTLPDDLLTFDMNNATWRTRSGSGPSGGDARSSPGLFYIPAAGEEGILVVLGGKSAAGDSMKVSTCQRLKPSIRMCRNS